MAICLPTAVAFAMGAVVAAHGAATITVIQHGLMLNKGAVEIAKGDRIIFNNG